MTTQLTELQSRVADGWLRQRVLILAPTGNDARLTQRFLDEARIRSDVVGSIAELCEQIERGCGTLLLAEETLVQETVTPLLETISKQASWSDIPLVLITSGGEVGQARLRRATALGPVGNVTMLERPFRPMTLLSAVETALRARNKQYEVRDLLEDVRGSERRINSILASITDGFVAVDRDWRFTYANAAYIKLVASLHPSETDLVGHNLWEKFPDIKGTEIERNYREAMAEQKSKTFEIYYRPLGTWLEVRAYPSPDTLSIYVRDVTERKRSEEAFKALTLKVGAQAHTFDMTLSNITDFAYILDREGRFVYVNKPLLDLWGKSLDEARGKNFFELDYPVELATKLQREIEHVFTKKEIVRGETAYTSATGQGGHYEYIFSPVFAPDGSVEVIAGSTRVITERRKAEEVGERRRIVLQMIAEDAPLDEVFKTLVRMVEIEAQFESRAGIFLSPDFPVDPAARRFRIGKTDAAGDAVEGQSSAAPSPAAGLELDTGFIGLREVASSRGLQVCWTVPIRSGLGDVLGMFVVFHAKAHAPGEADERLVVTAANTAAVAIARKRAEERLRASEAQLRLVTDHAPIYLVQCDAAHRYKFANRAYAERFGLRPQEVVNARVKDVLGPKAYATVRPHMEAALRGERVEFELEIPYPQQGARWIHTVYIPERGADGEVVGFVGVVDDVTARKQSELELMRVRDEALDASRAKDDFLAALSHELRTPLNPVLLIASEAAADPNLPPRIREDFDTIAKNATLEARLIDDLLDLTRITHGKMSLDNRVVDLHAVLADALETVSADLRGKEQRLNVRLEAARHHVFGDPARLQQIFWNVLKNAVKFTPAGGMISVETLYDPIAGRCIVKVRDSGIGMTADELARVFDAFAQGNHAQHRGAHRFGGLGLGLAISRMLVELHAGKISAESAGMDHGATFTMEFPHTDADADVAPATFTAPPEDAASRQPFLEPGALRRILVVEDHAATRQSLTRLLARRGYEVTCAGTVAEARSRAAEAGFDLVVSDIGLPDGDGYGLMSALRDEHGLTGIALSGYGMEQDIAKGRAAGFIAHLIKPVNIQALDRALQAWANTPRARH